MQIAVLSLLLVIVFGSLGYMLIEGWSLLDSLWMVVITITTIGYGEVQPLSAAGRVFSLGLIIFGVGLVTFTATRLARAVLDGEMARMLRLRRKELTMKKLKDHYIVVGYGRLGRVVVHDLLRAGVPVCVVERHQGVTEELEEQGVIPVVHGDGASDETLRMAGIERARGMAIALPSTAEAVYISMCARQFNSEINIVTRIDEPEATHRARRVGARQVVNPYHLAGWRIAHGLLRPSASSFLDLAFSSGHEGLAMDEQRIPDGSPYAGRSLAELNIGSSHGLLVVAIHRRDGTMLTTPGARVLLEPGDTVVVIGDPKALQRFAQAVGGGSA